jgi:hypothetical protein
MKGNNDNHDVTYLHELHDLSLSPSDEVIVIELLAVKLPDF